MTEDIRSENFSRSRFYKKYHDEIEIFYDFLLNKKVPEKIIEKLINAFIKTDIMPTIENMSFIQLKTGISLKSLGLPASRYNPFAGGVAIGENDEVIKKVKGAPADLSETFKVSVKDREIWINDYLLSKPHAVGKNFEFFDFVRQNAKKTITKSELPNFLKEEIGSKGFSKILNEIGFKGEILKAFFPKRSKKRLIVYRGDNITWKDLEEAGVKIELFVKELELAHLKNNPK